MLERLETTTAVGTTTEEVESTDQEQQCVFFYCSLSNCLDENNSKVCAQQSVGRICGRGLELEVDFAQT